MRVTSAFMGSLAEKTQIATVISLARTAFAVLWGKFPHLKDVPLKEQRSKEERALCPIQSSNVRRIAVLKNTRFTVQCVNQRQKGVKLPRHVKKTEHVVFSTIVAWSMRKDAQTALLVQKMENVGSMDDHAYQPNKAVLKVVPAQKKDAVGSMEPSVWLLLNIAIDPKPAKKRASVLLMALIVLPMLNIARKVKIASKMESVASMAFSAQ